MFKWLPIVLIVVLPIRSTESIEMDFTRIPISKRNNLHEFMNDDELDYYFGAQNKRNAYPDYEVVDLPLSLWQQEYLVGPHEQRINDRRLNLAFNAFGNPIRLELKPNQNLLSPNVKIVETLNGDRERIIKRGNNEIENCHFLHADDTLVAAVSNCYEKEINGIFLLPNTTLELRPLTKRLQSFLNLPEPLVSDSDPVEDQTIPHLVKRASILPNIHDDFYLRPEIFEKQKRGNFYTDFPGQSDSIRKLAEMIENNEITRNDIDDDEKQIGMRGSREMIFTVEVGVFFDEAGYKIFAPFFNYDDNKIRDMLLAYMNGVQALYHHPSLGTPVDITIVYIEIMKTTPSGMPHFQGERGKLLDQFCAYQKKKNRKGDEDPNHWDMGLYISGLDFFAYENGQKSGVTMGLATVGGVCLDDYACIIAEFGTTNIFGKPYPSAGFTSVYIMAHEIGHNLGMHHDSSGNSCTKEGYIMSPSRGVQGETTWSSCSASVIDKLSWAKCLYDKPSDVPAKNNAWKYLGFPGQTWTAKRQCEILLVDKDAYVSPMRGLEMICHNLQCRTPHRTGFYSSGPALDGTDCGPKKWCHGGQCSTKTNLPKPIKVVKGGWSPWKLGKCNSGCTLKSKGYQKRTRTCDNPPPQNTDEGCEGNSVDVVLCDDSKFCGRKTKTSIIEYASKRCKEFSASLPDLDPNGKGLQAPHEVNRLWMGCAVFCRRADTGSYYTPRIELNDLGEDPYFPDGTWCHSDNKQEYYCQQRHCLPTNYQRAKTTRIWELGEDIPIAGNAPPHLKPFEGKILDYLSLDNKGNPMLTHINQNDVELYNHETDWANKDYIELPEFRKKDDDEDEHNFIM